MRIALIIVLVFASIFVGNIAYNNKQQVLDYQQQVLDYQQMYLNSSTKLLNEYERILIYENIIDSLMKLKKNSPPTSKKEISKIKNIPITDTLMVTIIDTEGFLMSDVLMIRKGKTRTFIDMYDNVINKNEIQDVILQDEE